MRENKGERGEREKCKERNEQGRERDKEGGRYGVRKREAGGEIH